jgi:hypothetical protein
VKTGEVWGWKGLGRRLRRRGRRQVVVLPQSAFHELKGPLVLVSHFRVPGWA